MKTMPEIISIGAYDTSLVYKNITKTKPRNVSFYEFEFVCEDGGFSHINKETHPIKKHNIVCTKPGQIRHTTLPYKCFYIHTIIEDEELSKIINSLPDIFTPTDYEKYEQLFIRLIEINSSFNETKKLLLQSKLLELIYLISNETKNLNFSLKSNKNSIPEALKFIDENFTQNISLEDIASYVHMSKIYFHNIFKASVGMTIHRYVMYKKLTMAKKLLITTNKTLAEIAMECGFSSQSYFNYVFKKELGLTPKKYIEEIAQNWEN